MTKEIGTKKKLIIIHGLNNSMSAMNELGHALSEQFNIIYVRLPHHGNNPIRFNFASVLDEFRNELNKHLDPNALILSYSLGCAYLQLLLENKTLTHPLHRIIYLSPALKTKFNIGRFRFLPPFLPIPSLSPRHIRLRHFCYWGQYLTLYQLTQGLKLQVYPTIFADPADELIDLAGLEYNNLRRDYLSYGEHHLTIDPRYFKNDEWDKLMRQIIVRFQSET